MQCVYVAVYKVQFLGVELGQTTDFYNMKIKEVLKEGQS